MSTTPRPTGTASGESVYKVKRPKPQRLARLMRKRGWSHRVSRNGLRARLYSLALDHHPWWDWGHRLMIVTGTDHGGNWSEPEPPTWWYRREHAKPMWRTAYPRSTFKVVTSYDEFRAITEGSNEDQMYEWQAIAADSDHQLILGHRYWGGTFYGMPKDETALLRRYLRMWRRLDWFGLRSWLYSQGLHAAVHRHKPFSCKATPPKGQGGYSHWSCQQKKGHDGFHRFNNYTWGEIGGEQIGTLYNPTERVR